MVRKRYFKGKEFYFESGKIDIVTPPLQTGRDISGYCDFGDIYFSMTKANLLNTYQSLINGWKGCCKGILYPFGQRNFVCLIREKLGHPLSLNIDIIVNRPRSIYRYPNMAPTLSGQNYKSDKFLLSLTSQEI